ncbi:MAG TPA: DUF3501 family protein [Fimbriiglobus sp.]|jgi:hypothetical protein|nr:DUF3501 family protein [Fimbriiglobus sp.]
MPTAPLADVFAPDEFPALQDTSVDRRYRYLDRCRRVRVGPAVTVVFENQQTMWFRVQELAQVARAAGGSVQPELDWYEKLLPGSDRLHAAVWVAEPGRRPSKALESVRRDVPLGRIGLRADDGSEIAGRFRADRVADRLIGLSRWAEFHFTAADRTAFADPARRWRLFVEATDYRHESDPLSDDVRASLLEDLRG